MEKIPELAVLVLAVLGFVAWLGGGRKWAFRTLLATLILTAVGIIGAVLYIYGSDRADSHRAKKIRQCAIAKIVNARCIDIPKSKELPTGAEECPAYFLVDNPTKEQEEAAVTSAEKECSAELDSSQQSLHQELYRYRQEHGIKQPDNINQGWTEVRMRLDDRKCADKVRKAYPHSYDDLDDSTLAKKVLEKYPTFCDVQ